MNAHGSEHTNRRKHTINAFSIQYVTEKENNAHLPSGAARQALLGKHCCASGQPRLSSDEKEEVQS